MSNDTTLGVILVVGGTGFLGYHLVQDLVEGGVKPTQIHVLDLNNERNRVALVEYHLCDITNMANVKDVLRQVKPEVVFHAASSYPFETNRAAIELVNVKGTRNLLDSAQEVGVKAFVYTSSSSVVHDYIHPLINADESQPVLYHPQQPNPYSHSKAVAEDMILAANRSSGMLTVSIRPASLYGEADGTQVPNLVRNAQAGRAKNQIGPGTNRFDCSYVKNCTFAEILAAKALVKAAANPLPAEKRVEGEAFFVTDGDSYTFAQIARLAAEYAGHPVKSEDIRTIPLWLMLFLVGVAQWVYWVCTLGKEMAFSTQVVRMLAQERSFCIDKIRDRLNYKPLYSSSEGWKRSVDWYLAQQGCDTCEKKAQ